MFTNVTVNPSVGSGLGRDSKKPLISHDPRSKLAMIMLQLAKRRNQDQGPTADVQAAFKEGERAPVAGASI